MRAADVAHKYGPAQQQPDGRLRVKCFCHGGDGYNLAIWDDPKGFVRFRCHGSEKCTGKQVHEWLLERDREYAAAYGPPPEDRPRFVATDKDVRKVGVRLLPAQKNGPWTYPPNARGEVLQVRRFKRDDGSKGYAQYHRGSDGEFVKGGIKSTVPYMSNLIEPTSTKPILIVEGEKCCHAAQVLYGDTHHPITIAGGAKNINDVDLSCCAGKPVVIIADNDLPDDKGSQPGSEHAYAVAEKLREIAASVAIVPPSDDLPHKWDIANAFPEWLSPRGYLARAKTAWEERPRGRSGSFRPFESTETCGEDWPAREWVIEGLIPRGLTVLFGLPKVGKTLFVNKMVGSIAMGREFLGFPTQRREVLYIDGEADRQGFAERMNLLGFPQGLEGLYEFCPEDEWQFNKAGMDDVEGFLAEHPEMKIIVLDTMENLVPYPEKMDTGLNAMQRDVQRLKPLRKWCARLNVNLIIIHHPKKGRQEGDFFSQMSGSQGIRGTAETIIGIEPDGDSEELFRLRSSSRFMPGLDIELERKKGSPHWHRYAGGDVEVSPFQAQIVEFLKEHPYSTPTKIGKAIGKDRGTVGSICTRLRKKGILGAATKGGRYFVPKNEELDAHGFKVEGDVLDGVEFDAHGVAEARLVKVTPGSVYDVPDF